MLEIDIENSPDDMASLKQAMVAARQGVKLYDAWGKPEKASEWRRRAEDAEAILASEP